MASGARRRPVRVARTRRNFSGQAWAEPVVVQDVATQDPSEA